MISYTKPQDHGKIGLIVTGHAGYGPAGNDIVCSAVSAIAQTAAMGVARYDAKANIQIATDDGVAIACRDRPKTRAVIDTAVLGLDNIRKQYPQCFAQ